MPLLRAIKENDEIRKLFGKREIEIIEKQLLGINLTPSEKTRLSRDIRKKFKAIKMLAHFQGEFELKQGAEIRRIIEETKETILNTEYFSKIKRIILFGSSINKTRTLLSDVDISIEFSKIEKTEASKFRLRIISLASKNIDIQIYNFLPDKIKKQIDENGKTIYQK